MKKESDKKNKPWKGSRREEMSLNLPSHFIMLCHLLEVPAEKVLHDFMNTIAMESYGLKKETSTKTHIIFYRLWLWPATLLTRGYIKDVS
ncbi:MAG TPA: hypothetical protein VIN08_00800 [Ohtaekwangia sp.]|uniref:hypothetical protein n=1 Tax=Ohtaekwangia sp. TaxID=2066019 RepID=UPI002F95C24D